MDTIRINCPSEESFPKNFSTRVLLKSNSKNDGQDARLNYVTSLLHPTVFFILAVWW